MNRTSGVDSYEQMVADRVSAYVKQAQDYTQSTELAKRVARWHESIGPRCGVTTNSIFSCLFKPGFFVHTSNLQLLGLGPLIQALKLGFWIKHGSLIV